MAQKQLPHVSSLTPRILNKLPQKFRCRIRNRGYARQRQRATTCTPFFGSGAAGLGWIKALYDRSAGGVAVQPLRLFQPASLARQPVVPRR
jgi:hypothetical protein